MWAEGSLYKRVNWKFQYGFAVNNPPQLKGYTSGNNTTFMERGVVAAFFPSRNTGFLLQGDTQRLRRKIHWNIGFIRPEDELGTTDTDNAGVAGRFTYAFNPGSGDLLVHLGADYMRRNVDDTMNYLSRPEAHLAPSFVDTGDIPAVAANSLNLEAAVVNGPLSFQGELAWSRVETTDGSADPSFYAFYVYTSYFISGETRLYEEETGAFGRIEPSSEFRGSEGGAGALEVARELDLSVSTGELATPADAQGAASSLGTLGTFGAFLHGRLITHELMSPNKFRKRLELSD